MDYFKLDDYLDKLVQTDDLVWFTKERADDVRDFFSKLGESVDVGYPLAGPNEEEQTLEIVWRKNDVSVIVELYANGIYDCFYNIPDDIKSYIDCRIEEEFNEEILGWIKETI